MKLVVAFLSTGNKQLPIKDWIRSVEIIITNRFTGAWPTIILSYRSNYNFRTNLKIPNPSIIKPTMTIARNDA
jgi:hypothetical protein